MAATDALVGLTSMNSVWLEFEALPVVEPSNDALAEFGVDVADTELAVSKLMRGRWPGKWLMM